MARARRHAFRRVGGRRQLDREGAAGARRAVDADRPPHGLDQALRERQPETRALDRGGLGAESIEWPEELPELLGCDAGTGVGDLDAQAARRRRLVPEADRATL